MKKKAEDKVRTDDREPCEDVRSGLGLNTLWRAFVDNLICVQGKVSPALSTLNDNYMAFAYTIRDRMMFERIFVSAPMVGLDGQPFSMASQPKLGYNDASLVVSSHPGFSVQAVLVGESVEFLEV